MLFCSIASAAIYGIEARIIKCEADCTDGLPMFTMVGYLSSEVKEAKDRVRTAIRNSGFFMKPKHITVNLSPADVRKAGTAFDLPIAIAVMAASDIIPTDKFNKTLIVGELGLNGEIKAVSGVLPVVLAARREGFKTCIVPADNVMEGAVVEGIDCIGADDLASVAAYMIGASSCEMKPVKTDPNRIFLSGVSDEKVDFSEVAGQVMARRAVEIAVSGQHNIMMSGPPGAGKTMIARRIPTIMPKLTFDESMELSRIYSVAGKLDRDRYFMTSRPFRSPHHTATVSSIVGGGITPKPGEVSLAVSGVLFLDEMPEFNREVIEALRGPLEDRTVTVSRLNASYIYPARFMLAASMNPCPCGYYPDRNRCTCTDSMVRRYRARISQPILDRIDLYINVEKINFSELNNEQKNESSETIRKRVEQAVRIQEERYRGLDICFNSQLGAGQIRRFCRLGKDEKDLLEEAFERMGMSARGYHRILRVARTIADMEASEQIKCGHLAEALGYRENPGMEEWRS
ncbi:MAG: YifB family Mg chelatase-like AAA ATPase [Lachnospiraceae bacterium]|nr:YifB family Mg chelatase-like AAA ATPase [Lachnospiraceae bacterium]